MAGKALPPPDVLARARQNPGARIYKLKDRYGTLADAPIHAVLGWWDVDGKGEVLGEFVVNPDYRSDA